MALIFNTSTRNSSIRGLFSIAIGLLFILVKGLTMPMVMKIIGAYLVGTGLISMILSNARMGRTYPGLWSAQGLMSILMGLVFIYSPNFMIELISFVIGFILLIMGFIQLMGAVNFLTKSFWAWLIFLFGFLTLSTGIYLLSHSDQSATAILPYLGGLLILNGVSQFISSLTIRKGPRNFAEPEIEDIPYEEV